jgi:ankyrin repeat protein
MRRMRDRSAFLIRRLACLALLWLPLAIPAQASEALLEAAARGDVPGVQRLLDAGAAVNWRDQRGRNAVLAATRGGHVAAVRLLIARGADVNAQDDIQDSAFLLAGAEGHAEIVRLALGAGADLRLTNRYGGTALIPACHYGHVETVRVLLGSAIDVNHVNRLGWTALLEAVILGDGGARYVEIVRLLLAHGASPALPDRDGVTALAHAERRGQRAVAALLRSAHAAPARR